MSENETLLLNSFKFCTPRQSSPGELAIRKQREIFCLIAYQLPDFLLSRRAPPIDLRARI